MNARTPFAIATAILFAATTAAASEPDLQCTTNGGGWTVRATAPFDALPCPAERCTGMTYNITPHRGETPDHVAITVDWEPQIVIPPSTFDTLPCAGDNVSGLAARDCANQTSRINQSQQKTGPFDLVVVGKLAAIHGSIVVKKGKVIEQCRIATLGTSVFDPHAQITLSETLEFKGIPYFAPELFRVARPRDPFKAKPLSKGLRELGEEGAIQVFEAAHGGTLLLGAVGPLQFEIVAHRLATEYKVDAIYEPANISTARWLTFPDETVRRNFEREQAASIGVDVDANPVFLATNKYNLQVTMERWPKVGFHATREHGQRLA